MENGNFQSLSLTDLDFVEKNSREIRPQSKNRPTPFIPTTSSTSGTVETLLSQNEDLMARLKITLRRMTSLEEELHNAHSELRELKTSHSATQDQLLIWREKEKIWKEKNKEIEQELGEFKERFPEIKKMEYQLERYRRYQEKVKSTIKPYLQQLKDYAQSLHLEIQDLQKELHQKEALLHTSEKQVHTLREEKEQLEHFFQMNQNHLQESHEAEIESYRKSLAQLQAANTHLEMKAEKLNSSLERQDELENLVVALRRSREESDQKIQSEFEQMRDDLQRIRLHNSELGLQLTSVKNESEDAKETLHKERTLRYQLEEQLSSLRFMWTKKCEEFERLQLGHNSLEELNRELSQAMNKLREKNS